MEHSTDTKILIKALRILSKDIYSEDGVANAAILEGAERLKELSDEIDRLKKMLLIHMN
jgi:hypothetical protein